MTKKCDNIDAETRRSQTEERCPGGIKLEPMVSDGEPDEVELAGRTSPGGGYHLSCHSNFYDSFNFRPTLRYSQHISCRGLS